MHTHQLSVNGLQLATGDEISVGVIAGNISGRNFERREPWREGTHVQYLEWLSKEWGCKLEAGQEIAWGPLGMAPIHKLLVVVQPN